jgi:signal transduction histidine kinase
MGTDDDDDIDPEMDEAASEWERHHQEIHQLVEAYQEEHDLDDVAVSMMLVTIGLNMRMTAYALNVDKPSSTGLRLDLDRFKRDIDELLRNARKHAEDFVETAKVLIEAAADDADDEDDEDDEDNEDAKR